MMLNDRRSSSRRRGRSSAGRRARTADSDAREQLLEAAMALFAERGIANTTVAQIAAAGNVTSAMVHYWFDTRDRLLDAIVQERLLPRLHAVWDPADVEHDAPLELVQGLVHRMFEVTEKAPWLPSLWLREIVSEGGLLRESALRHIPWAVNKVAGFGQNIVRGQSRGEVNAQIDPLLLWISMLALVMVPQATAKVWRKLNPTRTLDRTALERHVTALLMRGIADGGAAGARRQPGKSESTP
jgi:TetR/AcrR family transcriptional regulator